MFNFISVRFRIALGLVSISCCVLMAGFTLGILKDGDALRIENQVQMTELLAVNGTILLTRGDQSGLETLLGQVVRRNPNIQSARVQFVDGQPPLTFGDHRNWDSNAKATQYQIPVDLFTRGEKAAELQMTFPNNTSWLAAQLGHKAKVFVFIGASSFLCFSFYLSIMLRQLDPSRTFPKRVRFALNSLAEGLVLLNNKGRVVFANKSFEAAVGRKEAELLGKKLEKLEWLDQENNIVAEAPWTSSLEDGETRLNCILKQVAKGGESTTFNVNCAPVSGKSSNTHGVMISFEDVTQLDQARVQIQKSKDEAEAANQAKSFFLANMSHEIRTPMNAILGFTDLLRRGGTDTQSTQEYLTTIHSSGTHLLELINDILDLSKIEAGKMELEQIDCQPTSILDEVVSIFRAKADEKGIGLHLSIEGKLPRTIISDPVRLRQVVTNLVSNAVKFTKQGDVTVLAGFRGDRDGGQMTIGVLDTGIGMNGAQQAKVFDPFTQADSNTTRNFGGTGLGLSICREITEALGGQIAVSSEPGRGSLFKVELPVRADGEIVLESLEENRNSRRREPEQAALSNIMFQSTRILVADDGQANRRLITVILEKVGCQVYTVENGKLALDRYMADGDFDLILMDMQMPVMDGYTATQSIRELDQNIPIVALTANAMRGDREKCIAAGCTDFLSKPVAIDKLMAALVTYVDTAKQHEQSSTPVEPPASNRTVELNWEGQEKICSSLPMEEAEFKEIVVDFVAELHGRLEGMQGLLANEDYTSLAVEAHWLKGAGGTCGFDCFFEPARRLELAARAQQRQEADSQLLAIRQLGQRIELPQQLEQTAKS